MATGYVNIDYIISAVMNRTEYNFPLDKYEVAEWAGSAMRLIGAQMAFDTLHAQLTVDEYKAELPLGIVKVDAVRDAETGERYKKSTDDFHFSNVSASDEPDSGGVTYKIQGGFIFFNGMEEGTIEISYLSHPVDENGLPMIPDVERYITGIVAYIIYRLDYRLWRAGTIPGDVLKHSEREWNFYAGSAHNVMVTPDVDTAENIFRNLVKIATDRNAHDYSFKYMNIKNIPLQH